MRIEFAALPKTVSGKIRRGELRQRERENVEANQRSEEEHNESDFPELSG
jgi:acetyl-CoA synthetase